MNYWRERRLGRLLPARADIDPAQFSSASAQVFIAGRRAAGAYPLRLAGEFLIDLHGRALRGEDFARLWAPSHRVELQLALERALRQPEPVVISAEGRTDAGAALRLEVLFAPLAGPDGAPDRFLGLYQPTSFAAPLGGRPVRELFVRAVGGVERGQVEQRLRLAALDGRRIA